MADPGELVVAWEEVPENLRPSVQFFNDEPTRSPKPAAAEKPGQSGKAVGDLPKAGTYYFTVWDTGDADRSTDPFKLICTFTPAADAFEPNPDLEHAHPMTGMADVPHLRLPRGGTTTGSASTRRRAVPGDLDERPCEPAARHPLLAGGRQPIHRPDLRAAARSERCLTVTMPATGPWYYSLGDAGDNDRSTSPFLLHTRVLSPEPTPATPAQ